MREIFGRGVFGGGEAAKRGCAYASTFQKRENLDIEKSNNIDGDKSECEDRE